MTAPQTGSIGEREDGREARVLGNVAKRAVESYVTVSLMIIDSSITGKGERPSLAGSHHLTESNGSLFRRDFIIKCTQSVPKVSLFQTLSFCSV